MKQKDLALILVVIFISAIVSLFLSKAIIVPAKNRQQSVKLVQPITSDFQKPDSRYFNSNAFDPTQPITIGQNNNTNPFNGTSQ